MGKLHHFVPRFYLRPWAVRDKIFCLQEGRIRRDNLKGLAAENYFYRLRELSDEDMSFIRNTLINNSPEGLRASHEELVVAFNTPFAAKQHLQELGFDSPKSAEMLEKMIVQLNEDFHTDIEDQFRPFLEAMLNNDLSFLDNEQKAAAYYRGLAVQYLRTNHVKSTKHTIQPDALAFCSRTMNLLVHIFAINLGYSLYADRKSYVTVLLDNTTAIPFVTGDQPIVNIAYDLNGRNPPDKLEFYYPLSPAKAVLLLEPNSIFMPRGPAVTETFVVMHNLRMAAHSYRQVFSNSRLPLESVRTELAAYMSCFP